MSEAAAGVEGSVTRLYVERNVVTAVLGRSRGQHRRVTVNISATWSREIHFGAILSTGASVVIEWAVLANQ